MTECTLNALAFLFFVTIVLFDEINSKKKDADAKTSNAGNGK